MEGLGGRRGLTFKSDSTTLAEMGQLALRGLMASVDLLLPSRAASWIANLPSGGSMARVKWGKSRKCFKSESVQQSLRWVSF